MHTTVRTTILLFLTALPVVAAPTLTTDPPPNRSLQNPIDLKITLTLTGSEAKLLNWRKPRVLINGTDISADVRPLLEGATAVPLGSDQFVLMDQSPGDQEIQFRVYGFSAPLGPHQVIVELPRTDGGAPLRYQAQYVVTLK